MKIILYPSLRARFYCQYKNGSTTLFSFFERLSNGHQLIHWDESTRNSRASFNYSLRDVCEPRVDIEFTVVRNSWERVESLYTMLSCQYEGKEEGIDKGSLHSWFDPFSSDIISALSSGRPFHSFVRYITSLSHERCDSHWQSQVENLPFGSPTFRVLRLEHLHSDFVAFVQKHLNADIRKAGIANSSASRRPAVPASWDAEAISLVYERYEKEISIFGFEPPGWQRVYQW